jgi:hypothetical protein
VRFADRSSGGERAREKAGGHNDTFRWSVRTARLEEAVAACRTALEERTRDRVPLDRPMTQNNLGNALWRLGTRESGTARLEEAVAAWNACLEVTRTAWPPEWVRSVETRRDEVLAEIARRSAK